MAERHQQQQRQRQQGSSFDVLLADLLQLVAEILLIRRPPVQTATGTCKWSYTPFIHNNSRLGLLTEDCNSYSNYYCSENSHC